MRSLHTVRVAQAFRCPSCRHKFVPESVPADGRLPCPACKQVLRVPIRSPVPAAADELRTAKESLVNSFVFSFTDPHAVVVQRMQLDFYGYPADYLARYRERIDAAGAADVQRVARDYLRPERQQIVVVGAPEEAAAALESLGLPVPAYLHLPLALNADGSKISKRRGAGDDPLAGGGGAMVREALRWLGQPVPADLDQAPAHELLAWGAESFVAGLIPALAQIAVDSAGESR